MRPRSVVTDATDLLLRRLVVATINAEGLGLGWLPVAEDDPWVLLVAATMPHLVCGLYELQRKGFGKGTVYYSNGQYKTFSVEREWKPVK